VELLPNLLRTWKEEEEEGSVCTFACQFVRSVFRQSIKSGPLAPHPRPHRLPPPQSTRIREQGKADIGRMM
jgi:hypothetical protein